jgi:hypothetical protein
LTDFGGCFGWCRDWRVVDVFATEDSTIDPNYCFRNCNNLCSELPVFGVFAGAGSLCLKLAHIGIATARKPDFSKLRCALLIEADVGAA